MKLYCVHLVYQRRFRDRHNLDGHFSLVVSSVASALWFLVTSLV